MTTVLPSVPRGSLRHYFQVCRFCFIVYLRYTHKWICPIGEAQRRNHNTWQSHDTPDAQKAEVAGISKCSRRIIKNQARSQAAKKKKIKHDWNKCQYTKLCDSQEPWSCNTTASNLVLWCHAFYWGTRRYVFDSNLNWSIDERSCTGWKSVGYLVSIDGTMVTRGPISIACAGSFHWVRVMTHVIVVPHWVYPLVFLSKQSKLLSNRTTKGNRSASWLDRKTNIKKWRSVESSLVVL